MGPDVARNTISLFQDIREPEPESRDRRRAAGDEGCAPSHLRYTLSVVTDSEYYDAILGFLHDDVNIRAPSCI